MTAFVTPDVIGRLLLPAMTVGGFFYCPSRYLIQNSRSVSMECVF